ncbi:MAG: hypothetical protein JWQ34_3113 [Mucilaginibacter sp.]|nr:hypothetical protein [Mucilaginibacter sp.]
MRFSFNQTISIINLLYNKHTAMNTKLIGIALIIVGAIMIIWTGFTYTKKEKIIDAGPIQVSADRQKTVNWPPYLGGILLIGGIVVVATSKKSV